MPDETINPPMPVPMRSAMPLFKVRYNNGHNVYVSNTEPFTLNGVLYSEASAHLLLNDAGEWEGDQKNCGMNWRSLRRDDGKQWSFPAWDLFSKSIVDAFRVYDKQHPELRKAGDIQSIRDDIERAERRRNELANQLDAMDEEIKTLGMKLVKAQSVGVATS